MACVNGHTICADCCNECRKGPDGKCPICGDDLLLTMRANETLVALIDYSDSLLNISEKDIQIQENPFARGVFGEVYMAKWRKQNVVIKIITTSSEEEKQAVKCEIKLTVRLNHPNVIKLFGITWMKLNKPGIVMEKAEHGSLDMWIGKIGHEKLTKIALGIIDGLEYVHSKKVIHRNVKPQNILMFGPKHDMIPKIADFGVSKVIQTAILTNTTVRLDIYIAPEVRASLRYSFSADIFSLAITLFEMFSNQLISHASNEVKRFITGIQTGGSGRISKSYRVPLYLRDVIESGWNKNADERATLSDYRATLHGKHLFLMFYSNFLTFSRQISVQK